MKTSIPLLSLLPVLLFTGCFSLRNQQGAVDALSANSLKPIGRTELNSRQELELVSSAAHFGFSFEGTECRIYAAAHAAGSHNYLQYELDGVYQKRVRLTGDTAQPVVITAPPGKHTVWVYKATEAHTGAVVVQRVTGRGIRALPLPQRPVVEFIGNSITCGAAADPSEVACGAGVYHDQHNAYAAYGPRVARTLKVNYILSSVSGIGVYRNWNSEGPTMPQVYERVDFGATSTRLWDFNRYHPRVISIALGTNDFSNGDGKKPRPAFDSAQFVNQYIYFVQQVKAKQPAAHIALLSSPMVGGDRGALLQNCLTAVKRRIDAEYPGASPVALFFFKPMKARGCTGHPSVEDHALLAEELTPFFRDLLSR